MGRITPSQAFHHNLRNRHLILYSDPLRQVLFLGPPYRWGDMCRDIK